MIHFTKSVIVRWKIFDVPNANWKFQSENGIDRALLSNPDWHAIVWRKPSVATPSSNIEDYRDTFLNECRRNHYPYTLDLWINGIGKVLSMHWDGGSFKTIKLLRGQWETIYFRLPSPKSRQSRFYVDLYDRAPKT